MEAQQIIKTSSKVLASNFYMKGDTVVNTWGCGQTNVEFYRVMRVTDRCIFVKEISGSMVRGSDKGYNGMACLVLPGTDILEKGKEFRLTVKEGGELSRPESFYSFKKWDGEPKYKSWYA